MQIESSIISQSTLGSHRSETQNPNLSNPLTSAAITARPETRTNIKYDCHSLLSVGPSTSNNFDDTHTVWASYPRVQSSAGRLEKRSESDRDSRPYQAQLEPTRHPQYSAIRRVNQEYINAEEPDLLRPSSAPVALANMSIDMLSQILPPKRDLPFAIVPAKRPRPEADSSSTVDESATSLKVVLKIKKDSEKAAAKQTSMQRAKPKKPPAKIGRPKASVAKKSTSKEVATQEANLREFSLEQVLPREVIFRRALPEPPVPKSAGFTTAKTTQNMPAMYTRSSSNARASQNTPSLPSNPSSQGNYTTPDF